MPFIRVTHHTGALTLDEESKLIPLLVESVMRQELNPVTENGRAVSPVVFYEIDEDDFFPGGGPLTQHSEKAHWIVEAVLAPSFFNQARREALQSEVTRAFVDVLGDDGSANFPHICCASTR